MKVKCFNFLEGYNDDRAEHGNGGKNERIKNERINGE